jgi:hypothetical protein
VILVQSFLNTTVPNLHPLEISSQATATHSDKEQRLAAQPVRLPLSSRPSINQLFHVPPASTRSVPALGRPHPRRETLASLPDPRARFSPLAFPAPPPRMLVPFSPLARNPSLLPSAARVAMSTSPAASAVFVEYAKSGRSTCKGCSTIIDSGALRLGASAASTAPSGTTSPASPPRRTRLAPSRASVDSTRLRLVLVWCRSSLGLCCFERDLLMCLGFGAAGRRSRGVATTK